MRKKKKKSALIIVAKNRNKMKRENITLNETYSFPFALYPRRMVEKKKRVLNEAV